MRPKQWIKNLFVFAPVLFARSEFSWAHLLTVAAAFAIFCIATGGIYILNDLNDVEVDRGHPVKQDRPIAKGLISQRRAAFFAILLMLVSFAASFVLDQNFGYLVVAYFVLNIAYTLFLKKLVIVDVIAISIGFIMRVVAGGVVVHVELSSWLILCTMLLSLFLGFAKRREEILIEGVSGREGLKHYTVPFLDQMMSISAGACVISYALYTLAPETVHKFGTKNLVFTVPFVIYGLFRFLYIIYIQRANDNPAQIVCSDRPLLIDLFLWVLSIIVILYL